MDYMSTKEAGKKFGISERRVQVLCDLGRIDGSQKVGGVWIIPGSAAKPSDNRLCDLNIEGYISLEDLCSKLSISIATGRNWIKLGKIIPTSVVKKKPLFSPEYISTLLEEIKNDGNRLKSRRNKKHVSGNMLYRSYVSESCSNLDKVSSLIEQLSGHNSITEEDLKIILTVSAIQLASSRFGIDCKNPVEDFLRSKISFGDVDELILDITNKSKSEILNKYLANNLLAVQPLDYEEGEDVLGLIYISLSNIGKRKSQGSYYTPNHVVEKLVGGLTLSKDSSVLDPCCGTGNFLLHVPKQVEMTNINAVDIDPIAVSLARINMSLRYTDIGSDIIKNNIRVSDYLLDFPKKEYDCILGNPPWGFDFDKDTNNALCKIYKSAGRRTESYAVFVEKAIADLSAGGILSFVLPESILNVKAHSGIRNIIIDSTELKTIEYMGNVFDGVQCPSIILRLKRSDKRMTAMGANIIFDDTGKSFIIGKERVIDSGDFSFNASDEEYTLIEKIFSVNHDLLRGKADFALGIVTGDNKKYVFDDRRVGSEPVLRGLDICKFRIKEASKYIDFKPESFQQVAPVDRYRAEEKLIYRFICNQLVFAYDNKQTLTLNSCNIVVPHIDEMETKYILGILNSDIAQFIFAKKYNSIKVLREHIESIPLPKVNSDVQQKIIGIVNELMDADSGIDDKYVELNNEVGKIFCLNDQEIETIRLSVNDKNRFLF